MNVLNRLTFQNLKLNKKRTIVTIIGILLSVALITAVSSIYVSLIKSLISYEIQEKGNFHVAYYDVPKSELQTFENNRSVDSFYITKNIGYATIPSKNENKPYAYIKEFTKESLENLSVNLVRGRLPENKEEILIPTHLNTNGRVKLNVGDTITLNVGTRMSLIDHIELEQTNPFQGEEEILNPTLKTYTIVGEIERPASNIESYSAPGYTFISYMEDNQIGDSVDIYVKYKKGALKSIYKTVGDTIGIDGNLYQKVYGENQMNAKLIDELDQQLKQAKYQVELNDYLITLETNPIQDSGIGGLGITVMIVLAIIVFTSIYCIKNSFDISITEKIKQYGMLRSIGATKKQIRHNVFIEATLLGIVGIFLGILAGTLASYLLILISNYFLKDQIGIELEFAFSIISLLIAILLGIVTLYASAFQSARKASKVSPIESIRNSASIQLKSKKIKSPKWIKRIFGIGGEISFKNLKRNKKKYRTTTISIIVSVFVFIALSEFMHLAFSSLKEEMKLSEYNITLNAHNYTEEMYQEYISTVHLNTVLNYTIERFDYISFTGPAFNPEYKNTLHLKEETEDEKHALQVISLGEKQYREYLKELNLSYEEVKDKGILLDTMTVQYQSSNEKIHKKKVRLYNFQKGSIVKGVMENTQKEANIEIAFVTEVKPFGYKNNAGTFLVVSDAFFDTYASSKNVTIYYQSSNANELQDTIEKNLKEGGYSINNMDESVQMMKNLFILVGIFLYGFIIVISLIGITNIFNTITTSMELRKPEFAMLKSIGMTNKEFKRMIHLESLFMGVKSLFFGIVIGTILSYILYRCLAVDEILSFTPPIFAIFLSIVVVFFLISVLMRYSILKINKQNTIETIRNENI